MLLYYGEQRNAILEKYAIWGSQSKTWIIFKRPVYTEASQSQLL
jgi:hypothetical protein